MKANATYNVVYGEVVVGRGANLGGCYDHPRGLVGDYIRTSKVVDYNPQTGRIETLNTIYTRAK